MFCIMPIVIAKEARPCESSLISLEMRKKDLACLGVLWLIVLVLLSRRGV